MDLGSGCCFVGKKRREGGRQVSISAGAVGALLAVVAEESLGARAEAGIEVRVDAGYLAPLDKRGRVVQ